MSGALGTLILSGNSRPEGLRVLRRPFRRSGSSRNRPGTFADEVGTHRDATDINVVRPTQLVCMSSVGPILFGIARLNAAEMVICEVAYAEREASTLCPPTRVRSCTTAGRGRVQVESTMRTGGLRHVERCTRIGMKEELH